MFGGLHTEMATFKVIGEWLEASGWTYALSQADVATSGTADSFLTATHVTHSPSTPDHCKRFVHPSPSCLDRIHTTVSGQQFSRRLKLVWQNDSRKAHFSVLVHGTRA